jgi:hypothetical protein
MRRKNHSIVFLMAWVMVILTGCVEPFEAPVTNRSVNFLVVDGYFDNTNNVIRVKLTRAKALEDTNPYVAETNAQVSLENESGPLVYLIDETGQGDYTLSGVFIDSSEKLRLRIRTNDGKEYESEFVDILQSPPIDSITWAPTDTGISIRVNTHDDENNTRYYQWRYVETWQYNAPQFSSYKYENGQAILRTQDEYLFYCWLEQPSTQILVHTSNRLESDVISNHELFEIPAGSVKISNKYSVLVLQAAISREAYDFWTLLKQTTEDLGGLFDPQPGKVLGNLRCLSDPDEPVLGYFQAGNVEEKRIFIDFLEISPELRYFEYQEECRPDSLEVQSIGNFPGQIYNLVNAIYEGLSLVGYTYTTKPCSDCRFGGGTLTKPDWWE